ncbi:hypothetical protein [Lederbergia lenta]|uniref:hypothetical protein n=1 Tax=Lederbergia lenta TaxID=1467 RepID=UPI00203F9B0B|nr:hypothetical protein [Lederbergia lenta]MCM3109905.1 hypothetical protein [Lederbergia lenta]
MARKVVCKICRAIGDTDTFYKVTNKNGKNAYFCNKEEYDAREKEKKDRYELLKYVAEEALQYDDGQIVPPSMVRRIEKLHSFYKYSVIKETFQQNKENIHYWMGVKDFNNEYGMSSYIMTIIESNINDVFKKWKMQRDQQIKMQHRKVDVISINQIEDENPTVTKSNNRDITMFLDEEDL